MGPESLVPELKDFYNECKKHLVLNAKINILEPNEVIFETARDSFFSAQIFRDSEDACIKSSERNNFGIDTWGYKRPGSKEGGTVRLKCMYREGY